MATIGVNNANATVQNADPLFFDATIATGQPGGYTATVDHTTGLLTLTPPANSTFTGTFHVTMGVRGAANSRTTFDAFDQEDVVVTVKPTTPTVDLVSASDTGVSNSDNITNASSLDFLVSNVTSGATVKLMKGQTVLASGTASGTSITLTVPNASTNLSQGVNGITAIQTLSSADSDSSTALNVTYDSTAPTFSTTAPTSAQVTFPLTYDAATNEDATGGVVYSLTSAPAGATINPSTGVLSWTPTTGQIGTQTFSIVATDAAGNATPQQLSVAVATPAVNFSLTLTNPDGTPVTSLAIGQNFVLHVFTQDVRSDPHGVFAAFTDVTWDGTKAVVSATTPEVQQIAIGSTDSTNLPVNGGSFKLTVTPPGGSAVTTGAITYSTTQATTIANIQAALNAALGAGTVTVAAASASSTTVFKITFNNTVGTAGLPLMVADATGLTLGGAPTSNDHGIVNVTLATGVLQYGATYSSVHTGDPPITAGLIDEGGGVAGTSETGANQFEVFSVPIRATAARYAHICDQSGRHFAAARRTHLWRKHDSSSRLANSLRHGVGRSRLDVQCGQRFVQRDRGHCEHHDQSADQRHEHRQQHEHADDHCRGHHEPRRHGHDRVRWQVAELQAGGQFRRDRDVYLHGQEPEQRDAYGDRHDDRSQHERAPVANNDTLSVTKNTTGNVLDVLANDTTGPDTGETLRVSAVGTGNHGGTITIGNNGANILYTPAAGFTGSETFTYTISDRAAGVSGGLTATASVTVNVSGLTATADSFTFDEDSGAHNLTVLANDLLDSQTTGGVLTITGTGTTDHGGVVTIAADNKSLNYTSASNFQGTEKFTYTISDGLGHSATGTVTMTVNNVNDPPTATNDTLTAFKNTTSTFDVLANDSSAPDPTENLIVSAVTQPSHGTVTISADGKKVSYVPTTDYTGSDSFTYTVKDPGGLTSTATANITVQNFVPSTLSGFVYFDVNNNGIKDSTELPIVGVTITLTGTPTAGDTTAVNRTIKTGADGSYSFDSDRARYLYADRDATAVCHRWHRQGRFAGRHRGDEQNQRHHVCQLDNSSHRDEQQLRRTRPRRCRDQPARLLLVEFAELRDRRVQQLRQRAVARAQRQRVARF